LIGVVFIGTLNEERRFLL